MKFHLLLMVVVLLVCGCVQHQGEHPDNPTGSQKKIFQTFNDNKIIVYLTGDEDYFPQNPWVDQVLYIKDSTSNKMRYFVSAKELHDKTRCIACRDTDDDGRLDIRSVSLSPLGNKFAVVVNCYNVTFNGDTELETSIDFLSVIDCNDFKKKIILGGDVRISSMTWSADEKLLAYVYCTDYCYYDSPTHCKYIYKNGIHVFNTENLSLKTLKVEVLGLDKKINLRYCDEEKVIYEIKASTYTIKAEEEYY